MYVLDKLHFEWDLVIVWYDSNFASFGDDHVKVFTSWFWQFHYLVLNMFVVHLTFHAFF